MPLNEKNLKCRLREEIFLKCAIFFVSNQNAAGPLERRHGDEQALCLENESLHVI
jgi:hypothetical protein